MAINKVGSKGIQDGAVAQADFADNAVTSAKLEDGAVTNAKLTNTTVTLAGQSITLGASTTLANKFVDWQSVITADGSTGTTAVSGQGYFIDTTSATHTLTLPASATIGDFIAIKDYAGTFNTNNLIIARNGHNIQGVANDSLIRTNRASLVLVYVDSTKGWLYWEEHNVADLEGPSFISATGGTITESGDFKIHSFTGDGCFVVSTLGNSPTVPTGGPSNVDYLVVAGGGGGGLNGSGAGGAGGSRTTFPSPGCNAGSFPISQTTYPITVGGGGSGSCGGNNNTCGSNSVFSTITSTGGGKGGYYGGGGAAGSTGGSGGGGGGDGGSPGTPGQPGGAGNTPPTSPPQGNNGGAGYIRDFYGAGGGGGGSGATGGAATSTATGSGGNGSANSITGSSVTRAGGGAGGMASTSNGTIGTAGSGGGGTGGRGDVAAGSGTSNSGSGGGAGNPGGAGGKGIVVIRYKFQ